jgi:hypothetical protein
MNYKFEFKIGAEIRNFLLHVLVGGIIAHTFLPYLPVLWILLILVTIGAGREAWQNLRGKIQPWWMSTVDALSFGLGGYIWWIIVTTYNINVDFL